jgi:hypothetical protein
VSCYEHDSAVEEAAQLTDALEMAIRASREIFPASGSLWMIFFTRPGAVDVTGSPYQPPEARTPAADSELRTQRVHACVRLLGGLACVVMLLHHDRVVQPLLLVPLFVFDGELDVMLPGTDRDEPPCQTSTHTRQSPALSLRTSFSSGVSAFHCTLMSFWSSPMRSPMHLESVKRVNYQPTQLS